MAVAELRPYMHYSRQPVVLAPKQYTQREPFMGMKPEGLWISVSGETDWPSWLLAETEWFEWLRFKYAVTLRTHPPDTLRLTRECVLQISNGRDLEEFHERYAVQTEMETRSYRSQITGLYNHGVHKNFWPIDWRKVAQDWAGLIIAPYIWSHRLGGPSWYYGWDCASGCIWDLDVIERFEPVYLRELEQGTNGTTT